jgi:hypothetical protein
LAKVQLVVVLHMPQVGKKKKSLFPGSCKAEAAAVLRRGVCSAEVAALLKWLQG